MANDTIRSYESAAEITKYWLEEVAPKYFDPTKINTYRAGTFGYMNDIFSSSVEDGFHAMMISKREVLPNTAQYLKSLYTHAASRFMDAPMAIPATANVLLMIQQSDILKYGEDEGNVHTFVLDDTFTAKAGDIQFMLDYPINIISVERENGRYAHTTHYDVSIKNSLATDTERYLPNKIMNYLGTEYLVLSARMRQVDKTIRNALITSNAIVSTVTLDFKYSGSLANFEVFYQENDASPRIQLEKIMQDSTIPHRPFCWYRLIDDETIRLTFPANIYFTPRLNAVVECEIYTTLGAEGNFPSYDVDIISENDSVRYPYNRQVPVFGVVDGSSSGGENVISREDFRSEVMRRYATNNTFVTSNDLQLYFDTLMVGTTDRFKFTPKRDDSFVRLHGAFLRMKDSGNNVVPTNTLDIILDPYDENQDFDIYSEAVQRNIIRPGALFTYHHLEDNHYALRRVKDVSLEKDLSSFESGTRISCDYCGTPYDGELPFDELPNDYACPHCGANKAYFHKDRFLFTNPYLISVSRDHFMAGYFLNSLDKNHQLRYTDVNDISIVQFIARHFMVQRNAIAGENFYKFSVTLSPSVDIDTSTVVELRDTPIVAKHNGYVESIRYEEDAVYAKIKYTDDPTLEDGAELDCMEETIQISSKIEKVDDTFMVCPICGKRYTLEEWEKLKEQLTSGEPEISETGEPIYSYLAETGLQDEEGNYKECAQCVEQSYPNAATMDQYQKTYIDYDYIPGYKMNFAVGDQITKNDVIATARPKDLGRIRLIMDLDEIMDSNAKRYIPMTIEEANVGDTVYFNFAAYLSTTDMIDTKMLMSVENGFVMMDGSSGKGHSIAMPIQGIGMRLLAFYQYREDDDLEIDVRNPSHKYMKFNYVSLHTYTNAYALQENDSLTLIKPLDSSKGFLDVFEREDYIIPDPPEPDPGPDPDPDPNPPGPHPLPEYDEHPEDPVHYCFLRTEDHGRLLVDEPDNDRYDYRYLTVLRDANNPDKEPDEGPETNVGDTPNDDPVDSPTGKPDGSIVLPALPYGGNFMFRLRNCPMVSAQWIKKSDNEKYFIDRIHERYADIQSVQARLENGFAIDMKFYNTYGKSIFYKIGNREHQETLDSVNITLDFGAGIIFPASIEAFRENFKSFVRDYIEADDDSVGNGMDLYLLNIVTAARVEFAELGYLEYYGVNDYDYSAQRITSMSDEEILETVSPDAFVPEFLNIVREEINGRLVPKVTVTISDVNV